MPISHTSGPKVGLAGVGRWGRFVLRDVEQAGCTVEIVRRDTAIEQMQGLDGFVIATPTPTHAELVWRALSLDVPVFVEKPLAQDADEADRLAAEGGDRLFVMDKWRWHPAVVQMRALADEGELGTVQGLSTRRIAVGAAHPGADPVATLAVHDLAIAFELFGDLPPARAATVAWLGGERTGMYARLGDDPWVHLEVSVAGPRKHTELRLVGDRATAVLDGAYATELSLVRDVRPFTVEQRPVEGVAPLLAELTAFADHLRGGPPPRSSAIEHATMLRRLEELGALVQPPPIGSGR